MKKFIQFSVLFLALTMAFVLVTPFKITSFAQEDHVTILQELNLLDKEGNTAAKLDSELTRAEGLTMVLKALGYTKEKVNIDEYAVLNKFTDIPDWFKGYAAIGVDLQIATGKTPELFDPQTTLTKREFITFVLRALKFDGTKSWAEADSLAKNYGLIKKEVNIEEPITKREACSVIFNALNTEMQVGTDSQTLGGFLLIRKAITEDKALKYGIKLVHGKSIEEIQKILFDNGWYGYILKDFQLQMTKTTRAKKAIIAVKDDDSAFLFYTIMSTEEDAKRLIEEGAEEFKATLRDGKSGLGDEHKKFFYKDVPINFFRKNEIIIVLSDLKSKSNKAILNKMGF